MILEPHVLWHDFYWHRWWHRNVSCELFAPIHGPPLDLYNEANQGGVIHLTWLCWLCYFNYAMDMNWIMICTFCFLFTSFHWASFALKLLGQPTLWGKFSHVFTHKEIDASMVRYMFFGAIFHDYTWTYRSTHHP